jgi:hypothetical protein
MDQLGLDTLNLRLERLERENIRLKKAGAVFVVALAAWVVLGSGFVRPVKQLVAERFVLKDPQGVVRAHLASKKDGSPELALFDAKGNRRVTMNSTADNTSSIDFHDKGEVRLSMSTSSDGASVLSFLDRNHATASGLYMWPDSTTGIGFRANNQGISMKIGPDGTSRLAITDKDGHEIEGMGAAAVKPSLAGGGMSPKSATQRVDASSSDVLRGSGSNNRTWLAP